MAKTYTIQNENGDFGFIQYIVGNQAYDEIMGGEYDISQHRECFNKITEAEYNVIKNLHDVVNLTGDKFYLDILQKLIWFTVQSSTDNRL